MSVTPYLTLTDANAGIDFYVNNRDVGAGRHTGAEIANGRDTTRRGCKFDIKDTARCKVA